MMDPRSQATASAPGAEPHADLGADPRGPSEAAASAPRKPDAAAADAAMTEYVGYLAGWFDLAQLAAGRRLGRSRDRVLPNEL